MVNDFLNFIHINELIKKDSKTLLAISGGVDSVVLCHLFASARLDFAIAHCNFGLRGIESDLDEKFVSELAKSYNVFFYRNSFDAEKFADEKKISIQMAARELRYSWFNELLNKKDFGQFATAHHQNDVVETVLLNLVKGTGIAGLHGILPKNNNLIRPLLFADKAKIQDYAVQQNLKWREDSSNTTVKYQRNLLRLEVIPLLKKINPDLERSFDQTIKKMRDVEKIFQKRLDEVKAEVLIFKNGDVYINKMKIVNNEGSVILLFEILQGYGFNYNQAEAIHGHIKQNSHSGRSFFSQDFQLTIDREHLIISSKREINNFEVEIREEFNKVLLPDGSQLFFQRTGRPEFIIKDKAVAQIDMEKLEYPLIIRPWKMGDWFYPLGMKGKKKISDFMIDTKIPVNLKKRIFLLTSGNQVVWVVGHRIDDRFKITDNTKLTLLIEKR
jgi:tRNA(Ile)-lysidine synthase